MKHQMSLSRVLQYLLTGAITVVVALNWEVTWRLAQVMSSTSKYWVLSLQFLISALTITALMLIFERRVPRISLKLFQAAVAIGFTCYFMPGIATFYSMTFMSPGVAALMLALVPLWLWIYRMGSWQKKLPALLIGIVGAGVFFWGSAKTDQIGMREITIFFVLVAGSFLYATGIAFMRRIFWMHYGLEINLWAMFFASALFALMSFLYYEDRTVPEEFFERFLLFLGILGFLIYGLGTFFYRYVAHHPRLISTMTLTLGIPLLAVAYTWISPASRTPVSVVCVVGLGLVLFSLAFAGVHEQSGAWMTHFLTNTRRVGERVVCRLNAFIKSEKGPLLKIDVQDLSIGGVGFTCDDPIVVGDKTLVSLPIGEGWTQISVEATIVHAVKVPHPEKPNAILWHGGLMFINLPEERLQPLVEFLAGVGHH